MKTQIFNNYTLEELPEILDAKTIGEFLGISYNSALKLVRYNMIYLKLGNKYRVTKINFIKFLQSDESREAVINR